ncbi:class I SAM-dependent methyltransferase [Corynebacterium sp. CMW7794]|uniref:class I SAM-dependent methyltransferase n=1 Tax=Corynebacterium sp. CMW7794 TaxID=1603887 RepID=UPI000832209A|nr:class I SAM-dependent methyltransferase [Corynebacterium sp. CMW7794]
MPIRTSSQANRTFWDQDAARYHSEHPEYLSSFYWCPEMLHERDAHLLGDVRGKRVLELGCGSAPCTAWLRGEGAYAIGMDISRAMLDRAPEGAPLVQADALVLPFADNTFDVVFSAFGALPFIENLDAALADAARVLRPAGRFVAAVPHPMRWIFPDDPQALTAEMSYFDGAYLEHSPDGELTYAEFHRTMGQWLRALQTDGSFRIVDLIEPEWPEHLTTTWGQWSPLRGEIFPGTAIFCCVNEKR